MDMLTSANNVPGNMLLTEEKLTRKGKEKQDEIYINNCILLVHHWMHRQRNRRCVHKRQRWMLSYI